MPAELDVTADEACDAGCCSLLWPPRKTEACGLPAVVRRGYRCRNGCWGEGRDDAACAGHAHVLRTYHLAPNAYCTMCGQSDTIEWFPLRPV